MQLLSDGGILLVGFFFSLITVELDSGKSAELLKGKYGNFLMCMGRHSQILISGTFPLPKGSFREVTV